MGLLEALFTFGNTLELIFVGGMLHIPPTATGGRESHTRENTLIPLYVEFKAKKCHNCSRPIVDYKRGLFCSNIFQGLNDLDSACYKFVCKDCLESGDRGNGGGPGNWDLCKNNLLYKCLCCRGQCPPQNSYCSTIDKIRDDP